MENFPPLASRYNIVFLPHTICSIPKPNIQTRLSPLCISHRFVSIIEPNACLGGAWLELEARPITPLPLPVLSGHLLRQIVLTEPLFNSRFLPAPMAVNEISLVQITTPFSSMGKFLYGTLEGVIVGIIFSGKSRTFPGLLWNKSGFPSGQAHPNRQRSHKPYARSHRHQKRCPSGC